MNSPLSFQPLPLPELFNDMGNLKLVLGLALLIAGVLVFSLWKERLNATKEEERMKFLMYHVAGGGWLVAVFAICGGAYFCLDSIFHLSA